MAKYLFRCNYCNSTWKKEFWSIPSDDELKCPTCNDSDVKKLKLDPQDVFGYNWKPKDKK